MAFPTLVSNVNQLNTVSNEGDAGLMGPFLYNGSIYLLLTTQQSPTEVGQFTAWKALPDTFSSWAELDAGNGPHNPSNNTGPVPYGFGRWTAFGVLQDPIQTNLLYLVYWADTWTLALCRFDMAIETWGTPVVSVLTPPFPDDVGSDPTYINTLGLAFRQSDGALCVMFRGCIDAVEQTIVRVLGAKILTGSDTWDLTLTQFGTTDITTLEGWSVVGLQIDSSENLHAFYTEILIDPIVPTHNIKRIYHQQITPLGVQDALDLIFDQQGPLAIIPTAISYATISADDELMFTYSLPITNFFDTALYVLRAQASAAPTWSYDRPDVVQGLAGRLKKGLTIPGQGDTIYFYDDNDSFKYIVSTGIGSPWSDPAILLTDIPDPDETGTVLYPSMGLGTDASPLILFAVPFFPDVNPFPTGTASWFVGAGPAPPVVVPPTTKWSGGGGTYFPRYLNRTLLLSSIYRNLAPYVRGPYPVGYGFPAPLAGFYIYPNAFDLCLSRDFQVFEQIDPLALACGRKPDCFLASGSREWVEPPAGAVTLNRNESTPLPAPTDGGVVIFSFRVPYGYDGILLAQFHGFTGQFNQGSGDLVWRVRVNGRYLQDMGNMLVSLGSSITLSPISGGSMVRSGNLVEYLVEAPNTTGSLPIPGVGNVLAGLHGYFFPRK